MSTKVKIHDISYDLPSLEADIWSRLVRGTQKSKEAFYTGVIANQASYGINLRTVVVRKVIPSERLLIFHTDKRSAKVKEIQEDPLVSWIFYDERRKIQLRMAGKAQVHLEDELAEQIWQSSSPGSLKLYLSEQVPASQLDSPGSGIPDKYQNQRLSKEEIASGRKNFVVISTTIDFIDWLYLNPEGHARAQFCWQSQEKKSNWVSP